MSGNQDDLHKLYRQGRIIPFLGAGCSMSVRWMHKGVLKTAPSWRELVDEALSQLGSADPRIFRARGTDLQILEYYHEKKGSLAPLINWLSRELSNATEQDILASPVISSLARLKRAKLYYTTNYDDFLERGLSASGRDVKAVTREHDINQDEGKVEVVKFHGDFNFPEGMVVSERQYLARMSLQSAMDIKLRADMLGRALLFVGYSFTDQNIGYLFHLINRDFARLPETYSGRRAFIVLPEPSEFERKLFHQRNIGVLPVGRDSLEKNIADLVNSLEAS